MGNPIKLLRIVPLIIFWVKSKISATERAKARCWQNQDQDFGRLLPSDMLTMLLGLVFCTICPLITVAALIYFATTYLTWCARQLIEMRGFWLGCRLVGGGGRARELGPPARARARGFVAPPNTRTYEHPNTHARTPPTHPRTLAGSINGCMCSRASTSQAAR